jgi:exopolysaccharide biosynthesis protein
MLRAVLYTLLVAVVACASVDYDVILANTQGSTKIAVKAMNVTGGGTQTHTQAFFASVSGINKNTYSPAMEPGGCTGDRQPLSVSAKANGCMYATNGAFFDYTAANHCLGTLIVDGKFQHYQAGVIPSFSQRRSDLAWIVGYVDNNTIASQDFVSSISGNCLLVRNGKNVVNTSHTVESGCSQSFIDLVAPRTAIGVQKDGSLILLQVDGIEVTSGMGLNMFADLLVSVGAWAAVNIDGGGSSTSYYNGAVINQPHCTDTTTVCERAIASITCVKA